MANIFQRFFGAKPQEKAATINRQLNQPGFRFIGGNLVPYDASKLNFIERGYAMNDMLYSVIDLIASKGMVAPMAPYIVQDEQKFFEYQRYQKMQSSGITLTGKDYFKMRDAKHKSLKLDTSDGYLMEKLQHPNAGATMDELNHTLFSYLLSTGDYFEGGWEALTGGLNAGKPSQMFELPSQYMWILAGKTLPLLDDGYELTVGGRMTFTKEEILHQKYPNLKWDTTGSQLYGMSPIQAALNRLQASNLGVKRQAKAMENAGADVVVYQDDPETTREMSDFSIEQMSLLKQRWNDEQAGVNNAGKAVWSPAKLGVARLGLSPVDLAQLPAEVANLRWFCNLYKVPSQLMNDPDNKTFANQAEGQRALLYNAVLPMLWARQKAFTKKLRTLPAYKDSRVVVEFDTSVYKELEVNKKELSEWIDKGMFNFETRYQYFDQEIPADMPESVRKAIIIPSGYQLLDDLFMAQDDINATINDLGDDTPYPVS